MIIQITETLETTYFIKGFENYANLREPGKAMVPAASQATAANYGAGKVAKMHR